MEIPSIQARKCTRIVSEFERRSIGTESLDSPTPPTQNSEITKPRDQFPRTAMYQVVGLPNLVNRMNSRRSTAWYLPDPGSVEML